MSVFPSFRAERNESNTSILSASFEPEEEWNRDAVLDPAWEDQQKKVCLC